MVQWRDIEGYVNWGLILMYGGAISLGSALNKSGAASWVSQVTIGNWASSPIGVAMMISLAAMALTEVMSHSAAVAIIMPVSIAVAQHFGMDPRALAPLVAVPAGIAFMLPVGTPANAIAFSSGYMQLSDMMWPGLILNILAYIIFNLLVVFYWPWAGVKI